MHPSQCSAVGCIKYKARQFCKAAVLIDYWRAVVTCCGNVGYAHPPRTAVFLITARGRAGGCSQRSESLGDRSWLQARQVGHCSREDALLISALEDKHAEASFT